MRLETRADVRVLDNGVTVRIERGWPTARAGVAWHFPAGFVDDPADAPGLAHLVEHLLFQASSHDGRADVGAHAVYSAGYANGTTHAEYTDFYRATSPDDLVETVRIDARRFRRLRVTEEDVQAQRAAVGRETAAMQDRAFGRFPWPALHEQLVADTAMTRNGFGDEASLSGITAADCVDFFETRYATTRAQVTVVAADVSAADEDDILREIARLPIRRPARRRPSPSDPWVHGREQVTIVDPHVTARHRFAAVGLPRRLDERIACLVLADAVAQASGAEAGRGAFGLLDTTRADLAIITARAGMPATTMARDRMRARWEDALANGPDERDWNRARLRLWSDLAAESADLTSRARLLGRLGLQHPDVPLDHLAERIRTCVPMRHRTAIWADVDVVPQPADPPGESEEES